MRKVLFWLVLGFGLMAFTPQFTPAPGPMSSSTPMPMKEFWKQYPYPTLAPSGTPSPTPNPNDMSTPTATPTPKKGAFFIELMMFAQVATLQSSPGQLGPPIVTPEPTVLPTSFERAQHPFTPTASATPALKMEPPKVQ